MIILFLLGRVMGLHAHGHVEHEHSSSPESSLQSHSHEHVHEKTHLVNLLNDSHDVLSVHSDHHEKVFEIELSSVLNKNKSNQIDLSLLFLVVLVALIPFAIVSLVISRNYSNPENKLANKRYLINSPLRAPPVLA